MECEIFRILSKQVSDHLSVLFSTCMTAPLTEFLSHIFMIMGLNWHCLPFNQLNTNKTNHQPFRMYLVSYSVSINHCFYFSLSGFRHCFLLVLLSHEVTSLIALSWCYLPTCVVKKVKLQASAPTNGNKVKIRCKCTFSWRKPIQIIKTTTPSLIVSDRLKIDSSSCVTLKN